MTKKALHRFYVIIAHLALSLLLTYPLVLKFSTDILGPPEDNLQAIWNFWWVKHALLNLGAHPYYTDYLFYPNGTSLAFHSLSLFNSLLAVPLQFFLNPIVCYNLLIILTFVLSGLGMYMLSYELTSHAPAAFIASLVFAYSPFHFAQAEHHLQVASIQFIPFFILYLIRLFEEPCIKNTLLAGMFLLLAALCSWYYLFYLGIFCIVFLIYRLAFTPPTRKSYISFIWMSIFSAVLIAPFIYPLLKEKFTGAHYFKHYMTKALVERFSADLAAFFLPSFMHPLASIPLRRLYLSLSGNAAEAVVFVGYTVLILSAYAVYKLKFKETGLWIICGLLFGILALGPRLHFMGRKIFASIPMPYELLYKIPLVNISRAPARFTVMLLFSLAVLVGYAVSRIGHSKTGGKLPLVLCGGLILFESLSLPMTICNPDIVTQSAFIQKAFSADTDDYAILELPLMKYLAGNIAMYRQTKHHKKITGGSISRLPHQAARFILTSPLKQLVENNEPLDDKFFIDLKSILIENQIKYIVYNQYLYDKISGIKLYGLLTKNFITLAKSKNGIIIFKVY